MLYNTVYSRQHLYQNPGSLGSAEQRAPRDRSLPPRVWSAARNQVMILIRCRENRKEEEIVLSIKHVLRLLNIVHCRKSLILNGRELSRITGETMMGVAEGRSPDQPSGITSILKSNQRHRLKLQGLTIQELLRRNAPPMVRSTLLQLQPTRPASALFPRPTLLLSPAARR